MKQEMICVHKLKGRECRYCHHNEKHLKDKCCDTIDRYCVFGDVVAKCINIEETAMKKEVIILTCTKIVNDQNEVQPNQYQVREDKDLSNIEIVTTTDFKFALQCFLNRT